MSNTGENAELIELLRDKSEDGAFSDFERHLFLKSAQAIAAADARIAEQAAEISNLDAELDHWSRLAVDDLGKNPPTSWKEIAETAHARIASLESNINRLTSNPADHRYWEGRYRDEAARAETAETLLEEAHTSIAQMRESLVETQIRSYGWMEAHDKLHAGKPYKFPSPADKPDILQALEEARRALEPFIKLADNVFSDGKNATVADEVTLWCFNDTDITFGDLRRVRATHDRIGK